MKYGIRATNWTNATLYVYYYLKSKKSTHFSEKMVLLPTVANESKLLTGHVTNPFIVKLGQFSPTLHLLQMKPFWWARALLKQRNAAS